MGRPSYWVNRIPVLSTAHVSQATLEWLRENPGTSTCATVANYPEGAFVYLSGMDEADGFPQDLVVLRHWADRRRYGWIRLDADGDVISGLPTFEGWEPQPT